MEKLYNLKYDFIKQENNYIVFSNDEGLSNDELNSIQVKMLLSNSIPNLLSLELEEMNLNIKLRYNISSKKTLNNYLKTDELNIKECLQIFSNIVSIINDSKLYMLENEKYIIHPDFIYIDAVTLNIFLIYLPLKNITGKESFHIEFNKFLLFIFNSTNNIDVIMYNKIINYIENTNYNILDLKQNLSLLLAKDDCDDRNNSQDNEIKKNLSDVRASNTLSRFRKFFLLSISSISIIFMWFVYFENQNEGLLYISLGVSVLIIDATYIILSIMRTKINKVNKNDDCNLNNERKRNVVETDETILLKNNNIGIFLEVDRGTEIEKISIENKRFVIGRNKSVVNYIEKANDISRVHLEIIKSSTGYLARDLGSKNKSYLNGDELIPNKIYPIKNEDVIKLATTEFIVREVSII